MEADLPLVISCRYGDGSRRTFRWTGIADVKVGDIVEVQSTTHGTVRAAVVDVGLFDAQRYPAEIKTASVWSFAGLAELESLAAEFQHTRSANVAEELADLVTLLAPVFDRIPKR